MGRFAVHHNWGRDEGCTTAVGQVQRLADAGGLWAIVPCVDAHLGRIRHEAIQQFGCLVLWGRSSVGDDLDVLLPLASAKDSTRFLAFLDSVLARFSLPRLLCGEGFDMALLTAQVRCTFGAWDGTATSLGRMYADLRGLDAFELLGSYDGSLMRRMAEARRPAR